MPGPPPKPRSQRRRRNAEPGARTLKKPTAAAAASEPKPAAAAAAKPPAKTPAARKPRAPKKPPADPVEPAAPSRAPAFPLGEDAKETTRRWWATIWASPMAEAWLDADVPTLHRLCMLVDLLHAGTITATLFREITALEDRFGLSPKSRRQLGWEFEDEQPDGNAGERPPAAANVVELDGERWRRAAT